jgi:hypothetical protein
MANNDPNTSLEPQSSDFAGNVATDPGHKHTGTSVTGVLGQPMGLTGATASTRYVGGTVSGAPVSGTFAKGDFVIDESGIVWICTTAGTPGTWVSAGAAGVVTSFNTRTGAVTLLTADVTGAGGAVLSSPAFTGTPTAPTAAAGTNTTQLATTGFTAAAILVETNRGTTAEGLLAPKVSPTFTGTTTAPEFSISGLTGAVTPSRLVGANASGAPTTGTFAVNDVATDSTGKVWICTIAGTPGTWATAAAVPAATTVTGPDLFGAVAVVGTGTSYARNDHDHGLPAATAPATTVTGPDLFGAVAVVGTGTTYSRADHNHGLPAAGNSVGTITGDLTTPAASSPAQSVAGTLASVGTAGTYGSSSLIPVITTDAKGRVTAVTTASPSAGALTYVESYITANVSLTAATAIYNITSVSLAAGTWLVTGRALVNGGSSTGTVEVFFGPNSASYTGVLATSGFDVGTSQDNTPSFTRVIVLGSTTTIYLMALASITGIVVQHYGVIAPVAVDGITTGITAVKIA